MKSAEGMQTSTLERHCNLDFAALWDSGPWRKIGRRLAATRFHQSVKTDQDWLDIQAARDMYQAYCLENRSWYHPVLGSVWFGSRKGWREWIPERVEAMADDKEPVVEHKHHCAACSEDRHDWICTDEYCWLPADVICPEGLERRKARTVKR
jgi:hypothetical protein